MAQSQQNYQLNLINLQPLVQESQRRLDLTLQTSSLQEMDQRRKTENLQIKQQLD